MWRTGCEKLRIVLVLALACASVACQADAPKGRRADSRQSEAGQPSLTAFSGRWACGDAADLGSLLASRRGHDPGQKVRQFLRRRLEGVGADVSERVVPVELGAGETGVERHLIGLLPGQSTDRLLLVAAYGTPRFSELGLRENDANSPSVGLVLELARVLSLVPRRYTVMVVLLDETSEYAASPSEGEPDGGPVLRYGSSRRLADRFAQQAWFERVRAAVFFQHVVAPGVADGSGVARDLFSHPVYRDVFFDAASALGFTDMFSPNAPFGSPEGSHRAFIEQGLPRVVAIASRSAVASEGPARGKARVAAAEECSTESLLALGSVSLEAIERISARLARLDRFRESPLESPSGSPVELPPAHVGEPVPGPEPVDDP